MKVAPGAWRYTIVPLAAAPFAVIFSVGASIALLVLSLAIIAFFRDPDRTPPPSGVVAPADGTVSVLRPEGDRFRVGTFMNVHNVHVVRSPFEGTVREVEREPGGYKPAFSKDSDMNEKVHVRLEVNPSSFESSFDVTGQTRGVSDTGADARLDDVYREREADSRETNDVSRDADDATGDTKTEREPVTADVTFIAGAFARRIHPYVEPGDTLERGERIGHIAFGSRVDVLFPPGIDDDDIAVDMGDSMRAGETVILQPIEYEEVP
ncbi:protein sorting system archaetidylserine decarboxylase [Natrialbaceae archaeon A-CW2]